MKAVGDGKHSAMVAEEFITSIRVPIIPDADEYMARMPSGRIYTMQMPDGTFGKACTLPFTEANGKIIEAWMAKHRAKVGPRSQFIIHLEDDGCVRLGIRREPRDDDQ